MAERATADSSRPGQTSPAAAGRARAVIDRVSPAVGGGRFPVKRVSGETLTVEADCFADGHDALRVRLRWRREDDSEWREAEMAPQGNDRWRADIVAGAPGRYRYHVVAWADHFASWRSGFVRRKDPADLRQAAEHGAPLLA